MTMLEIRNSEDLEKLRTKYAAPEWLKGRALKVEVITEETGKWGMARVWRKWMAQTAEWMAQRGATMPLCIDAEGNPYGSRIFNPEDAHELFTMQWLGVDADGKRLSWSKKGRDDMRPATKGERFLAMQHHENWCTERGIALFNPRHENEYRELQKEQVA